MKVSEVMTKDVMIANPNQTIGEAARMMAECDAGALPVGGSPCGGAAASLLRLRLATACGSSQ